MEEFVCEKKPEISQFRYDYRIIELHSAVCDRNLHCVYTDTIV